MLKPKQAEDFKLDCAKWLEKTLKSRIKTPIKEVYSLGREVDFSRAQIKAARAWHGKWITTVDDAWGWDSPND